MGGKLTVHPYRLWIVGGGCQSDAERGAESGLEEENGHDEGFHARRRFGEGVFETGDAGEDFRERDEEVRRGLDGNVDPVVLRAVRGGAIQRVFVAGSGTVDQMLGDGRIGHRKGRKHEAHGDSGNGSERDADFFKGWVDEAIQNWDEDDERQGVNVLQKIVGYAMEFHGARWTEFSSSSKAGKKEYYLGRSDWSTFDHTQASKLDRR